MDDPGPVPTMTGGAIADGLYVLTSAVSHGGVAPSASNTIKQTFLGAGNIAQIVTSFNGAPDFHYTVEEAPSGIDLHATDTCPEIADRPGLQYTATPTSFVLVQPGDPDQYLVLSYAKQ